MIVYKATNLINGKIYIGQTSLSLEARKRTHFRDAKSNKFNMLFHNAIREYGTNCFVWEIIDQCLTSESFDDLEKHYIKLFHCKYPDGYNLTDGGKGGCGLKISSETRKKKSDSMRGERNHNFGKHLSEETKQKIRIANIGKHHSEETKKKMSAAHSGEKHHFFGKHHTEESRKKMIISHKGQCISPEARIKISIAFKKKYESGWRRAPHSDETRQKMSESAKRRWGIS
jgi:group I intron endonuclease